MKTGFTKCCANWHRCLAFVLLIMASPMVAAQDVVLTPSTIQGAVGVSGYELRWATINAGGAFGSATQRITPNAPLGQYNLTVNVPENGATSYQVSADDARIVDDDGQTYLLRFRSQAVTVQDGVSGSADFVLDNPGFIIGVVSITNDANTVFTRISLNASSADADTARIEHVYLPDVSQYSYRMPVAPGTYSCGGTVQLSNSTAQILPRAEVAVLAGETAVCDFPVEVELPGSIAGSVSYTGDVPMDAISVRSVGLVTQTQSAEPLDNTLDYLFEELPAGQYRLYPRAVLGEVAVYEFVSQLVDVAPGQQTTFDVETCQAYFDGQWFITGSLGNADVDSASIRAISSGVGSGIGVLTGDSYSILATEGEWSIRPFATRFRQVEAGKPDIDNSIRFLDYPGSVESLVCGQSVTTAPIELETGTATINFSVSTGELLSRPEIDGSCRVLDDSGQLLYRYAVDGRPTSAMDVQTASVRFAALAGTCNLVATADVNGSNTEFGSFTVPIVPGTDVVIDIGAPMLSVNTPQPGICVADTSVVVAGTVQDDSDVASVTVNGADAPLTLISESTYSFSIAVPLVAGINEIVVQAVDTSGNQITDRRTVNQDSAPPTVTWSPLDGTTVSQDSVEVTGIASDESDIASVTINGDPVSLQSTGVAGEYTFALTVPLQEGDNVLTLVARDQSGCEDTVQVRNIEFQLQPDVTGVTRSKGYWSNHPDSIQFVLDQFGSITRCDGVELTSVCDIVDTLKLKGNRDNANAKRQSAAAALNCWAFGCESQIVPEAACSNALGSALDDFSNSGTHLSLPPEFSSNAADPKFCR